VLACNLVNRAKGLDRIWILKSADDGASWSKPVDITKSVGPVHPGPGRGILLKSGRLVIPGRSTDKHGQSLVIYSDDHGKSWKAGADVAPNTTESQVVELADGRIMINMRSTRSKGCRWRLAVTAGRPGMVSAMSLRRWSRSAREQSCDTHCPLKAKRTVFYSPTLPPSSGPLSVFLSDRAAGWLNRHALRTR
jgi:Neuraminidase (sialidase)